MDPNANLKAQLAVAERIQKSVDSGKDPDPIDADHLATLVLSLNTWIRGGGSLPINWNEVKL